MPMAPLLGLKDWPSGFDQWPFLWSSSRNGSSGGISNIPAGSETATQNGNLAQPGEKQGQADFDVVKPEHRRLNLIKKIRHDS